MIQKSTVAGNLADLICGSDTSQRHTGEKKSCSLAVLFTDGASGLGAAPIDINMLCLSVVSYFSPMIFYHL